MITPDFSMDTLKARRAQTDTLQALRDEIPARLLYPAKLSIMVDTKIKTFHIKQNLSNIYIQIQLYRRCLKENSNLKRLTTPKKTQGKNYSQTSKSKEGKHTYYHNK